MNENISYNKQLTIDNTSKLRELLTTLPGFCKEYFRAIEPKTSTKTRISYVYDLRVFFQFLIQTNPQFKTYNTTDFKLEDLEQLESVDIEEYLEYLKLYQNQDGKSYTNDERGIHRKLSSLRSFYYYFNRRKLLKTNPSLLVDMPKIHSKEIVRLDYDEVAMLLDLVEHGSPNLTGRKKTYFKQNKLRNLAIFTLLLGTGIRVSECVGLDLNDVDFKNDRIKIIRKGGKEDFVYFGIEVEEALRNYIEVSRTAITPLPGHENALFLSIQKRRMTVRAIENLVSDYASQITTLKHITPHKLRSTYGTTLYRETGDIYLVAEVLGHNDVNTTKKHYAALDEDRKRKAANVVKLRES
ncbi:tyrosine-type recombinase/integrase [Velocimicrobium porci]|uniref:Tyrosine-type recombinase/integrase n=1 Tax=Velocimicrobium porci TaxID=2606634 RepID=A0A6L5XZ36_9FIRM|nr:tyrosine-type recombinase/integrase [Velocimicrobium porci]MSS63974.1 tyrosine-type recombinase/integrase [Velocimicrobium porci]